jgi:hypothetical protein
MKIDRKQIRYSLQLLLHLRKNTVTNNQDGYAMLITSILAILMFSMLSVYLFSANLYKSVATAVVDSGSTFYAAELGMNKRANIIRDKFEGFSTPTGTEPTSEIVGATDGEKVAEQMQNCINNTAGKMGTGDMACNDTPFDYKESRWKAGGAGNSFGEEFANNPDVKYRSYSFVRRITDGDPAITRIAPGEDFAGLNMLEYKYRLYATALKKTGGTLQASAQTLLQMDFNSRVIPIFQFAAFYQGNMEVSSTTNMDLRGAVHSNGNIYFSPGGILNVGQTTAGGRIYKSLAAVATHGATAFPGGRSVVIGTSPAIDVTNAFTAAGFPTGGIPITPAEITDRNGLLRNNSAQLTLPAAGALGTGGNYFTQADLRVTFDPDNLNAHPYGFGMTSILKTTAAGVTTNTPRILTNTMLRSLRQPVMLVTQGHGGENKATTPNGTTEWNNLCMAEPSGINGLPAGTIPGRASNFTSAVNLNNALSLTGWSFANATLASNALRRAIAKTGTMLTLTQVNNSNINSLNTSAISGLPALNTAFSSELDATTLSVAQKTTLLGAVTPRAIANRAGNCFLPPPMQVLNTAAATPPAGTAPSSAGTGSQRDRQETNVPDGRLMKILQANIHSLTVWNRDGQYDDGSPTPVMSNADGWVFARLPAVTNGSVPVGSYDWMGMATSDKTERGLVWHSTVDTAVPAAQRGAGVSQYGFGFSGGRWLPGPLTIATDQIAYMQGDFNNPGGVQPINIGDPIFDGVIPAGSTADNNLRQKKPAAIMADAITVLSNNCVDDNGQMDCFNIPNGNLFRDATRTSINAAFYSGTSTGGGLNNYMRMLENWHSGRAGILTAASAFPETLGPTAFRYRGSFVSSGNRANVSGPYQFGCGNTGVASATCYYNVPARDFGFDTSFNTANGLPPLSPQAIYLKQKVFRRDYDNNRS